jgi:hypothetical protein
MKFIVPCLAFLAIFSSAEATQIVPKDLTELIAMSDHVLVVKIAKVSMVDSKGKELRDPEARTGPGIPNELRLHVDVQEDGVLMTTSDKVPAKLVVPLWRMWHFSLGQWKKEEGSTYIFLLKGENYIRVSPMEFMRDLSERAEIERLIEVKGRAEPVAGGDAVRWRSRRTTALTL